MLPCCRFTALTSSDDGTLRTWDTWTVTQRSVIKPTLSKPARVSVTTCRYGRDGAIIGAGLMDGTLQLWDAKGGKLARVPRRLMRIFTCVCTFVSWASGFHGLLVRLTIKRRHVRHTPAVCVEPDI